MSISAPVKSEQYVNFTASPRTMVPSVDWGSKLRANFSKLTFTAAGFTSADAADITLIRMPAGPVRILGWLSRVVCPVGTSTSDLDIGWSDYTSSVTGLTVTGDPDGLADSLDVGGAAIDAAFILPAAAFFVEINSASGFDIVCSFDTANSPAAGSMYVTVVYQIGN